MPAQAANASPLVGALGRVPGPGPNAPNGEAQFSLEDTVCAAPLCLVWPVGLLGALLAVLWLFGCAAVYCGWEPLSAILCLGEKIIQFPISGLDRLGSVGFARVL